MLPQRPPPPPPWAGASPPQGPPTAVAPWAEASQRLATVTTANLVDSELRLAPLARFAVVLPAIYSLVNLIENRINAQQLRNAGHQFHLEFHDAEVGKTAPAYHGVAPSYSVLFFLLVVLTAIAVVVACVWQHRAASAGRALGLPARHSPAWGVGAWFVPVVNLWIPYGAIRDCLPPDDPRRVRVLQWWIAWLIAAVSGLGRRHPRPFLDGRRPRRLHPRRRRLHCRDRLGARNRARGRGRPSRRHGGDPGVGRPDRLNRAGYRPDPGLRRPKPLRTVHLEIARLFPAIHLAWLRSSQWMMQIPPRLVTNQLRLPNSPP